MHERIRYLATVSIVFSALLFSAQKVSASFGVSPADITVEHVAPGMTVNKEFLLSRTDLERDLNVVVEADVEGANTWIKVDPSVAFTIPRGERTKKMKVSIAVPKDAPYREYKGYITVKTSVKERSEGVAVVKGVGIAVNLITTTLKVDKLLIREVKIPEVPQGSAVKVIMRAENQGNTDISPEKVSIKISDLTGKELFSEEISNLEKIRAGETKEIVAELANDLATGEYEAKVEIFLHGKTIREDRIVFRVGEASGKKEVKHPSIKEGISKILPYALSGMLILVVFVLFLLWKIRRQRNQQKSKNL